MNKKYKIAITDDEALFRKGMEMILSDCDECEVVFEAENGQELLNQLETTEKAPDVILLDLQMPVMDGVDTLKALQGKYSELRVIVLTSHYNASMILRLVEEGASAFLPKNVDPDELIRTIQNVVDKGFHYNSYIVQLLRERMLFGKPRTLVLVEELTKREKEILLLICDQYTNKEIADKLFISSRTVEGHRNKMLEKTQSKNTVGLIIYAIEHGLVSVKVSNMLNK
ncbi:MAG: response regulator transcription factor [Saprospiraceae bacterium]|nr:response regulator transcription factor [Saprospiraceae bacterium]MCB9323700.1 response regulator transcription factor [Lewinellaceae bacterium]